MLRRWMALAAVWVIFGPAAEASAQFRAGFIGPGPRGVVRGGGIGFAAGGPRVRVFGFVGGFRTAYWCSTGWPYGFDWPYGWGGWTGMPLGVPAVAGWWFPPVTTWTPLGWVPGFLPAGWGVGPGWGLPWQVRVGWRLGGWPWWGGWDDWDWGPPWARLGFGWRGPWWGGIGPWAGVGPWVGPFGRWVGVGPWVGPFGPWAGIVPWGGWDVPPWVVAQEEAHRRWQQQLGPAVGPLDAAKGVAFTPPSPEPSREFVVIRPQGATLERSAVPDVAVASRSEPQPAELGRFVVIRPRPAGQEVVGRRAEPVRNDMPLPAGPVFRVDPFARPVVVEVDRPEAEPQQEAARLVQRGRQALAAGEYGRAAELFAAAGRHEPDALPRLLQAQAELAAGRYLEAAAVLQHALQQHGGRPLPPLGPQELYGPRIERFAEQLAELRRLTEAYPQRWELHLLLGWQLWNCGDRQAALQRLAPLQQDPAWKDLLAGFR